ncbi:hypothetical protein Lepto7375DRAFT_1098 [Leptolyngbya sp. PCC 7375]|nr:hypothetical protein Lepto7375DRAFT_1098 [Leptolyngbya sp. PCC 7375]
MVNEAFNAAKEKYPNLRLSRSEIEIKKDIRGCLEWVTDSLVDLGYPAERKPYSESTRREIANYKRFYISCIEFLILRSFWGESLSKQESSCLQRMLFELLDRLEEA